MDTARSLITAALHRAGVLAASETATAEQAVNGLEILNEMLQSWRDNSVDFGLTELSLDTPVAIDAGAARAVKYNLAVELANHEHAAVPQRTTLIAEREFAALVGRFVGHSRAKFDAAIVGPRRYDINSG